MKVWDREKIIEVPEVGLGAIRFAYGTVLGRFLSKALLCRGFISNIYGLWQRSRLSKGKVQRFIDQYHIDLSGCGVQEFSCFNDFFTRQRQTVDRTEPDELPAIADSKLLALPISMEQRFSIKDVPYTVAELLENPALAKEYEGGYCLIFRLAPDDYHRYAYPASCTQEEAHHIQGVLHTVNPIAADLKVYRRNTRNYTVLHTDCFGKVIQMEVGALLVGKIINHDEQAGTTHQKLAEKGYFAYGGSTVILLLQKDTVQLDDDILLHSEQGIETKVSLGEKIGRKAQAAK